MSAKWVAGSIRAKALLNRRVGPAGARSLAQEGSLRAALVRLTHTAYGRDVRPEHTLADAEHAIGSTLLWHMRVLAGWQPRAVVRLLAGGFEISNVEDPVRRYRVGALASCGWGDPGTDDRRTVGLHMRLVWADRVMAGVPEAARWACGAAALLVARELYVCGRRLDGVVAQRAAVVLGARAMAMDGFDAYVAALPRAARWAFGGELWQAEARWWRRVDQDSAELVTRARFDRRAVVGAVGALAADAWRVRAALQVAARGGVGMEVFDAVA
ncbi:hypothetical protein GCM10029964_086510 [Kibdelosporangium lantanae]